MLEEEATARQRELLNADIAGAAVSSNKEIREEASDAEARTGSNDVPSPEHRSLVDEKAAS